MYTYKNIEEEIVIKPFTYITEACPMSPKYDNNRETMGRGALIINKYNGTIDIDFISGASPYVTDILFFVLADKDVRLLIRQYQQSKRTEYFEVRHSEGFSGREDYYINFFTEYGLQKRGKKLLHVSNFDKLNEGWEKMWVGDFVELMAYLFQVRYYINEKYVSSCRYAKGYFAKNKVSKTVTKLI